VSNVDGLAAHVLDVLGMSPTPPVDVERVARLMGVSEISDAELVEDGRLECARGSHRILLRQGLNPTRRRFTVGHELAHLLMSEEAPGVVGRRALPVTGHVERFCDSFAAALLLPRWWIRERYAHRQRNLSTVRNLAMQTGTSMAAAVMRLNEVLDWPVSLLRWKKEDDRWRFLAGAAIPSHLFGRVGSAEFTSSTLDEIGRRTRRDVRTRLPVRVSDRDIVVDGQVSVRGKTALVLAELENGRGRNPGHDVNDAQDGFGRGR
jgi:hypothetical protein